MVVLLIVGMVGSSISRLRWEKGDHSIDAVIFAKYQIKEMFVAPASARFPNVGMDGVRRHVSRMKNQTYKVHSWVDSQNRFGAMIRANYTALLRRIGPDHEDFEVLDIHLDE